MQQYYTLEEAADKLGIPVDDLREKAKKKQIRAFQDRGNWRFRAQEIDEMARQMHADSGPSLTLGESSMGKAKPKPPEDSSVLPVDFQFDDDGPKSSGRRAKTPPPKKAPPPVEDSSVLPIDFKLDDSSVVPIGEEKPSPGPKSRTGKTPAPKSASDSDVRLVPDAPADLGGDSDVRLDEGPKSSARRRGADSGVRLEKGSDSDVKLVDETNAPDSDVRLEDVGKKKGRGPEANIITEEIDLDAEEAQLKDSTPPGGSTPIKPRGTKFNPQMPVLPTSSPYEISENDLGLDDLPSKSGRKRKARPAVEDSSSEHELIAFDDDKVRQDLGSGEIPLLAGDEEVDLGELPAPNAGNSGINLKDAADSGISLEDGGSDELEFELSIDGGNTPRPEKKQNKAPVEEDSSSEFELTLDDDSPSDPSSSEFELSIDEPMESDPDSSDSEFELTLDDEGGLAVDDSGKDIFEETNFDVPALEDDSGSEAVALGDSDTDLESSSDFELSMDDSDSESGSQVVTMDDEEADDAAATVAKARKAPAKSKTKTKAAPDDEEGELDFDLEPDEDDEPVSKKKPKKKAAVKADEDEDEDEDDARPAAAAPPAEWGPLPVVLLFPTVIVLFVVGLMGYELIQGMWGYHRASKVGRPIIDNIARLFDDKLPKD